MRIIGNQEAGNWIESLANLYISSSNLTPLLSLADNIRSVRERATPLAGAGKILGAYGWTFTE